MRGRIVAASPAAYASRKARVRARMGGGVWMGMLRSTQAAGLRFRVWLVGACGRFAGLDLLEKPGDRKTGEAEDGEPSEDVDKGPECGLASKLLIEKALSRVKSV